MLIAVSKYLAGSLKGKMVPQQNQRGQCCLAAWHGVCCTTAVRQRASVLTRCVDSAVLWARDVYSGSGKRPEASEQMKYW